MHSWLDHHALRIGDFNVIATRNNFPYVQVRSKRRRWQYSELATCDGAGRHLIFFVVEDNRNIVFFVYNIARVCKKACLMLPFKLVPGSDAIKVFERLDPIYPPKGQLGTLLGHAIYP